MSSPKILKDNRISYQDTFFRLFSRHIESGISWPVNLEMLINKEKKEIVDGKIHEEYIKGKEVHLSITNLYSSNVASVQIVDLLKNLSKIFKRIKFKFMMVLENSDHSIEVIRKNVNFEDLELNVRRQKWWRLIFVNRGLKERFMSFNKRKIHHFNHTSIKEKLRKKRFCLDKEKKNKLRSNNVLRDLNMNVINNNFVKDFEFHNTELPKIFTELEVSMPISPIVSPSSSSTRSSFLLNDFDKLE